MSHTFDSIHQALSLVKELTQPKPKRAEWVGDIHYHLRAVIDALHGISHDHEDWLNHDPRLGRSLRLLDVCLQYEDDDDRTLWLKARDRT